MEMPAICEVYTSFDRSRVSLCNVLSLACEAAQHLENKIISLAWPDRYFFTGRYRLQYKRP